MKLEKRVQDQILTNQLVIMDFLNKLHGSSVDSENIKTEIENTNEVRRLLNWPLDVA